MSTNMGLGYALISQWSPVYLQNLQQALVDHKYFFFDGAGV
jgi:hypothetical protein